VVVLRGGSALVSLNKVNLRLARLVLGWVTVTGPIPDVGYFFSVCTQPPRSTLGLGHPFLGKRNEYQPKGGDALQLGSIKAGMVRVWVVGKIVRSPCYTRAISERSTDVSC